MERIRQFVSVIAITVCICVLGLVLCAKPAYAEEAESDTPADEGVAVLDGDTLENGDEDAINETHLDEEGEETSKVNPTAKEENTQEAKVVEDEPKEGDKESKEEPQDLKPVNLASTQPEYKSNDKAGMTAASGGKNASMEAVASTPLLSAGDYVIKSALSGCYVLDVSGGSTKAGANIQIYSYNATGAQKWRVAIDKDGFYTFKNLKSGLFLEFVGSKTNNCVNVRQNSGGTSQNKKWKLEMSGSGFVLVSAASPSSQRFVLDVSGGRAANGSNVQLYKANNTAAQRFVFTRLANAAIEYETPLEKGEYVIQSGVGGQYVLDVSGASKKSGANVQIYSYNGTNAQKWKVTYDDRGLYTFTSVSSGKALDLSAAKASYGRNVQQYTSNKTNAQKWIITKQGNQYKVASAVDPMFVLDVSGAHAANGANVQVYGDNATKAQRFAFLSLSPSLPTGSDVADGVYVIAVNSNSNFVLDVSGGSVSNGANVQIYKSNNTSAQRWGIVRNSNDLYSIFNMASGKMLDVSAGKPVSGANVQQYTSNDTKAQQWAISKNAKDGSITLFSAISGNVIDVSSGKIANGSNVQTYLPNGTAAQKFKLVSKPLIEERTYMLFSMRNPSYAVDVPSASQTNGKALQVYKTNDTLAQHVVVNKGSGGTYTLQIVSSGKYLTDENGVIKQRSAKSGNSQQWKVSLKKGGIVFTNVATGKAMGVAASSPKNGTALVATSASSANSKFGLKSCNLISDGLYTLASGASKSGRMLDVAGGSWSKGTNVRLFASNGTNAQKFAIAHVSGDYYRIIMALSGLAVEVKGGSKKSGANVDVSTYTGSDAQLWKPVVNDGGLTFTNKGSGMLLEVDGGVDKNGANVDQRNATTAYSQKWVVNSTSTNYGDMNSIVKLVRSVASSSSVRSTFNIATTEYNKLMSALRTCWNAGFDVGFILTDLQTGNNVSLNADRTYYGACTMKAAYITWIFAELLEKGRVSWGSIEDYVRPAIIESENSTYLALRDRFGSGGFVDWLHDVGVDHGYDAYEFYTPRELQLMWVRIMEYEQSGGRYVNTWRNVFGQTKYTPIADELRGGSEALYSKPGWMPRGNEYETLSDSGIVVATDGRRYLLTIMSTIDCYNEYEMAMNVARALDSVFKAAPKA